MIGVIDNVHFGSALQKWRILTIEFRFTIKNKNMIILKGLLNSEKLII